MIPWHIAFSIGLLMLLLVLVLWARDKDREFSEREKDWWKWINKEPFK